MTGVTDAFSLWVMRWLPMNGTTHEHADQPVDDRRDAREQPHDGLEHALERFGAKPTRNTEMNSEQTNDSDDRARGREDRAPDQRPGVERVNRRLVVVARVEDRDDLGIDAPAGAEPAQAVVSERRPGLLQDEGGHRQQQEDHTDDERAEPKLGALVRVQSRRSELGSARASIGVTHCRRAHVPAATRPHCLLVERGDGPGFVDDLAGGRARAGPN